MSTMRDNDRQGTVDVSSRMQLTGNLLKRPFGHPSNRWTKRFFVVRDGFLLYYAEAEKKEYERRKCFNIHPKGVIPLGSCNVETRSEPGQNFCISLESSDYVEKVVLAADNEFERDRWVNSLMQACKITHENLGLGDSMIRQLESHGLQMAREKQDYYDMLQSEVMDLANERLKTEELEKVKEELEMEKLKMAKYAKDIREEYDSLRQEMSNTSESLKSVEEDKRQLLQRTEGLQHNMQNLETEKSQIVEEMTKGHTERQQLSKEKETLSETTESLKQSLKAVEKKIVKLDHERLEAEDRLDENESRAEQLEKEKFIISQHAAELKESIKEISAQKAITEAELKAEIMARMTAERRLQQAEVSLTRLEKNVERAPAEEKPTEDMRQEMIGDVRTLKKFFENLAFEAKLEKDKPIMIKNSIHTKKNMVKRAKTMRHEANKKKKSRPSILGKFKASSTEGLNNIDEEPSITKTPIGKASLPCLTKPRVENLKPSPPSKPPRSPIKKAAPLPPTSTTPNSKMGPLTPTSPTRSGKPPKPPKPPNLSKH